MFFGKRKKTEAPGGDPRVGSGRQQMYRIDFDMMLKGSRYKRRSGEVRQFGVTVDGATRLVTSGDLVDKATYEALVAVAAIRDTRRDNRPPTESEGTPKNTAQKAPQQPTPDLPPPRKKSEREHSI